eukprot:2233030-Pleurochrysis_carterae.AAC.1
MEFGQGFPCKYRSGGTQGCKKPKASTGLYGRVLRRRLTAPRNGHSRPISRSNPSALNGLKNELALGASFRANNARQVHTKSWRA